MQQTIRMVNLQISCDAFGAKPALVHRKVITRLETDDVIVLHQQIHTALNRAVRTVRRHDSVDHAICTPTIMRRVVEMRPKLFYDLFEIADLAHALLMTVFNT